MNDIIPKNHLDSIHPSPTIYVDADACPVKEEIYRVARRYGLSVVLASNSKMRVPFEQWVKLVIVGDDLDAADDWIVREAKVDDIVISNDVPLASRCVKEGIRVISPTGRIFTEESMGESLATRDLLSQLRSGGMITSGPSPFSSKDRSRFLSRLDETIQAVIRKKRSEHIP